MLAIVILCTGLGTTPMDDRFQALAASYIDQVARLSPVDATGLGDHRFDGELDDISAEGRQRRTEWLARVAADLKQIDPRNLSRPNQVDFALLRHAVRFQVWQWETLREWSWNPLVYTGLLGDSVQRLLEREFAPEAERLANVARRLERFPAFLEQVRSVLVPARVPAAHADTAVAQNKGLLKILDLARSRRSALDAEGRAALDRALDIAARAINEQQIWLERELLPHAKGDYRIGRDLFDKKLAFTLHSTLRRDDIRAMADRRVAELHDQMYALATPLLRARNSDTPTPDRPTPEEKRAAIRAALELACADAPSADEIVDTIRDGVTRTTDFVREKELVTLAPDPLEIVLMPEFRQGVSAAYCDAPGPLETNQKTFYAVSPIPKSWSETQAKSFLREYNRRSLDVLTIHEAMPGHFLQLALSNRYKGRLRHLFQSGVFVEGWAVYAEWMMCEAGFRDADPLLKLVTLKWYLRDATNAILDQAVHVDGITQPEAMRLLMEDALQEEREAAGKWRRAQLTSAQLSTYFTGYVEHVALRKEAEQRWGNKFRLKDYHDRLLSFGSPPPAFARALLFEDAVPEE
jgi:uncharacterized protein (DUF885 family)